MLWYKNWLETRWLFLFAAAIPLIFLPFLAQHVGDSVAKTDNLMQQTGSFWAFAGALVAGAGIRTRSGLRSKGVHGSMYYLLSMPVSRARLFLSRVSLGFAQLTSVIAVACVAHWVFCRRCGPTRMVWRCCGMASWCWGAPRCFTF